jgi:hypothetical protein
MGAKTWMLVYADSDARAALAAYPPLDREATSRLASKLFPKEKLEPLSDGDLCFTSPPEDELHIGCFAGVSVVAATELGLDHPSKLPKAFLDAGGRGKVYLHAMHSVVDWFAFGLWSNGTLIRSLSVAPDNGIIEDIGQRLPFEEPYWSGKHPVTDGDDVDTSYPFPFHPLEFGEGALLEFFGYQIEGFVDPSHLDVESIPLVRYKRSKAAPWWKLW